MPDTKITSLTELLTSLAANDLLPLIDVSDPAMSVQGTNKKVQVGNLLKVIIPLVDSVTAHQIAKAGGAVVVLNVDTTNGRVGIGNVAPLAPLHVGNRHVNNSVDAMVLVSRNVGTDVTGNGHAFSDSSDINRPGTIGYNSFDARITYSGAYDYDHLCGFQFAPVLTQSGIMANLYGFAAIATYNGGVLTNNYGFYVIDPAGTGVITNNYGLYVGALSRGTNNWALYLAGTANKSYIAGNLGIGRTPLGKLDVQGTKANAGSYNTGLVAVYDDSAVAAGVGGAIIFYGKYTGTTYTIGGGIECYKVLATDGDYSFGLRFQTRNSGSAPATKMTLDNLGNLGVTGGVTSAKTTVTVAAAATTFAIASNVVIVTGDAGGNTVATITGGAAGQVLVLIFVDALVTITDTAAATANTVNLSAAFTSAANTVLQLVHNGTKWLEVSRSVNG